MSIKKKMGIGILSGALGLSLIGSGTWAAFNDVEKTQNSFTAGTLDLVVGEATTMNFEISNLKPGDYFTKQLVLANNGSLDINDIFVHAEKQEGWVNEDILNLNTVITTETGAGDNSEEEFLSQFSVKIKKQNATTYEYEGTLADLVAGTAVGELTGTYDDDATTNDPALAMPGLAAGADALVFEVEVEFVEDGTKFGGSRLYKQNKYQGERSNLKFVFEATQMPGVDRDNN